jgi:hypothetical protein
MFRKIEFSNEVAERSTFKVLETDRFFTVFVLRPIGKRYTRSSSFFKPFITTRIIYNKGLNQNPIDISSVIL